MNAPVMTVARVEHSVAELRPLHPADQVAAVTAMLGHARFGLRVAIEAQNLPGIVEWKAKASAIADITKQLQLGKDMQLDAAEFLRQAERGIGVAIREGQARGEIASKTNGLKAGPRHDYQRNGKTVKVDRTGNTTVISPTDLVSEFELSGKDGGIYAMTDGVSDEAFEEALTEVSLTLFSVIAARVVLFAIPVNPFGQRGVWHDAAHR